MRKLAQKIAVQLYGIDGIVLSGLKRIYWRWRLLWLRGLRGGLKRG
jgi:hypothetical protein